MRARSKREFGKAEADIPSASKEIKRVLNYRYYLIEISYIGVYEFQPKRNLVIE